MAEADSLEMWCEEDYVLASMFMHFRTEGKRM